MAVTSAALAVTVALVSGAVPVWAVQAQGNGAQAGIAVHSEIHRHNATQRIIVPQEKPQARQSKRRSIVAVGPQAETFQRIRALAMAPTG